MARNSQLEGLATVADTVRISSVLQLAAVEHLILDGCALAAQTTASPASCGYGDIDVLVRATDRPAAMAVLRRAGLTLDGPVVPVSRASSFPVASRVRRLEPLWLGQRAVHLNDDSLDDALDGLTWGLGELVSAAEWLHIGGVQLPTLNREHAAILSAYCAASGSGWNHLRQVVDQASIMRGLDREELVAEARRVGGERQMEIAVAMVDILTSERSAGTSPVTRADALRLWRRLVGGRKPYERGGQSASLSGRRDNTRGHHPSWGALLQSATGLWPMATVARRPLATVAYHPWLSWASSLTAVTTGLGRTRVRVWAARYVAEHRRSRPGSGR